MEIVVILLSIGLPLVITIGFLSYLGRLSSSVWFWTYFYIRIKGKKSTAIIVDSMSKITNITINKSAQYLFTVVLDVVDPDTFSKYRIKRKYLDNWYSALKDKNVELPVIIHPANSELVIPDKKEMRKKRKLQLKQIEESEENRLNKLMNS
ncbi:MAG: hypothetical protein U0W24_22320 [Bacteroidales bacterium]